MNFRSSCIPLQIIMAMGLIRTVSSLIEFCFTWFVFLVRYEDMGALHGGLDGLDVVKRILCLSPGLLKPDGYDMKIMIAL